MWGTIVIDEYCINQRFPATNEWAVWKLYAIEPYIVRCSASGRYTCSCPSRQEPCKHITMVVQNTNLLD